jgi:uncharacterized protein YwqG
VESGNTVLENIDKRTGKMDRKPTYQTRSSIQKRVSQKSYERKLQKKAKILPTKQDKLEENKDLEEMEEEEGIDLERGGGYLCPEQGDPRGQEQKNPKRNNLRPKQKPVYKYNESDMEPFKVLIRPAGSDPKNNPGVVDI